MTQRVPPLNPLTRQENLVAALVAHGYKYPRIAELLHCSERTVRTHIENIAAKIPGDLPQANRIAVWWRGASKEVLTGSALQDPTG